jgi:hypothetical protein
VFGNRQLAQTGKRSRPFATQRYYAPAIVCVGGRSRSRAGRRGRPGTGKHTTAVTIKPTALAIAVRRSVASSAKTSNTADHAKLRDNVLWRVGDAKTSRIKASAAPVVATKRNRGIQKDENRRSMPKQVYYPLHRLGHNLAP